MRRSATGCATIAGRLSPRTDLKRANVLASKAAVTATMLSLSISCGMPSGVTLKCNCTSRSIQIGFISMMILETPFSSPHSTMAYSSKLPAGLRIRPRSRCSFVTQ